jgi:transcriptional regulator with XRE-family HTH domain
MKKHPIIDDLRRIRQEGRISQEAIGAALDKKTYRVIGRYERGDEGYNPSLSTITAWADTLGYEIVLKKKE